MSPYLTAGLAASAVAAGIAIPQLWPHSNAPKQVSRQAVAAEVCEHNGPVQSVVLSGAYYEVRCASDLVEQVAR